LGEKTRVPQACPDLTTEPEGSGLQAEPDDFSCLPQLKGKLGLETPTGDNHGLK